MRFVSYGSVAGIAASAVLSLSAQAVELSAQAVEPKSPHEAAARLLGSAVELEPPAAASDAASAARANVLAAPAQTFNKQVMGYYSAAHGYPASMIPYSHLSYLNWFGIESDASGNISKTNGWGSSTTLDIVASAHAVGTKVLVTVVMFDDTAICSLLNSSTARTTLINNLVSQVKLGKADGVSVDFENPTSSCMSGFETLTRDLATALHSNNSSWHLSLALPPVDWSKAFHYDILATYADSLFIMGYGFHYSSSDPGPIDPLYASSTWGNYCLDWTVKDYISKAGAYKHKIILGLPLYGFNWTTTDGSVPGDATATAPSIKWKEAQEGAAQYGRLWDDGSDSPYYVYNSGGWHQVWYQDVESMTLRFDYINQQDIGGVGFWAVGFDQQDADLWSAVDEAFTSGGGTTPPTTGNLVGYIRESDIYNGPGIVGATVTLSSGQSTTTDEYGYYRINGLAPGVTYTVTASAPCYTTVAGTKLVEVGIDNWKSIALEPAPCPPDDGNSCESVMGRAGAASSRPAGISGITLMGVGVLLLGMRRRARARNQ